MEEDQYVEGVAVFGHNSSSGVKGFVVFEPRDDHVKITVELKGLKSSSLHGFHIHQAGDLRKGCDSCCAHYNPTEESHGDINDEHSHSGDLGNIKTNEAGECNMILRTRKFIVEEIIGRSVVVHENPDDLGKTDHKDSKTTGNSGKRIACSVIGIGSNSNC